MLVKAHMPDKDALLDQHPVVRRVGQTWPVHILVVDIGASSVKIFLSASGESRHFDSRSTMTPDELVSCVKKQASGWKYDLVSIGYPGKVGPDGPSEEPGKLGDGWVGFDFPAAFGCPVRVVNDAVLQAIGGYVGGRMLFLGFGTGLGSALIVDYNVVELDLGRLPVGPDPHAQQGMLSDWLGHAGLLRNGRDAWLATATHMVERLRLCFLADYVVIGGGHASEIEPLPKYTRRGGNEDAFAGGVLLWHDGVGERREWREENVRDWRLLF